MSGPIKLCGHQFEPASDEWDRLYGVDFYLKVGVSFIGIQIKPRTYKSPGFLGRYKGTLRDQHRRFRKQFGGTVFVVVKDERSNPDDDEDLCAAIESEIKRLQKSDA